MSVLAIVQARMQATRLPGKVLEPIGERTMLERVVARVRAAERVDDVLVATSTGPADDAVEAFCRERGIAVFRGDEHDVLDRYFRAAASREPDVVVRITADCPLMDPAVVDQVVERFARGDVDYAANVLRYTWPDGLDVEVFSMDALRRAHAEAKDPVEREHVTVYVRTSGRFRTVNVERDDDLSRFDYRFTVDEPKDLAFVRAVYDRLEPTKGPLFDLDAVLALVREEPALLDPSKGTIKNEGYYLSILKAPPMDPKPRSLDKSKALLARATKVVPTRSQTFSKAPTQFPQGSAPTFLERGKGGHVFDVDGNEYIDWILALGPIILGYDDPAVTEAVVAQAKKGASFSLPTSLETEVAEQLVRLIPCAEMVRFGKNGSDVTSGAVRVARAFTKREKVVCCGYHGWQDWFIGTTTRNQGVPKSTQELTKTFDYNDLASLERVLVANKGEVACVIMEPIGIVHPEPGFLEGVKRLAHDHGALLVFDEVVTGFRVGLGGAQELFGVTPDLGCFGKAMGNGYPIAAVCGRADVMKVFDDIFFSFTFGGDAIGLAASLATIQELERRKVIPELHAKGDRLRDGFNTFAKQLGLEDAVTCMGLGPHTVTVFKDTPKADALLLRSLVQQELARRGVLFLVGHNLCAAHTDEDVEHTLRAHKDALAYVKQALDAGDPRRFLDGEPVSPVFRKA